MSKVTVVPWTDELFDAREAEFASLVLDGVSSMAGTALAMLRRNQIVTAASAPRPPAEPQIPPAVQAAALGAWGVWVETELDPAVADVFAEGADLVVDKLLDVFGQSARDLIPPVGNEHADEYLRHASNRMKGVGENVWKGIKRELEQGLHAGEGITELAERLQNYAQLSESRARTVARTEVISSANAGSYLQMVEAGIDGTNKEWLATDDHRTRVSHRHADDQAVPLTAEFQVEVYTGSTDGKPVGTEPMEFPGDPIATPANVINCRCSLGFSFDDEDGPAGLDGILTAAFVESQHPRDSKGKFMNKLEIDLLNAEDKKAAFDKLSNAEKAKIGKATKDKAGVGGNAAGKAPKGKQASSKDNGPALGGLDKKTGKRAAPGKPVFLRVKTLFETDYEDGAIVAVRPESDERVVWDAGKKRMLLQHRDDKGGWTTQKEFTRGALMKEAKDEEGWFTPSPANTAVPTADTTPEPKPVPAPAGFKPAKIRTQVVYGRTYADGEMVAVHPEDDLQVVWDADAKRMLVQRDGETQETLTRGALMSKYKDADGWFAPEQKEEAAPEPPAGPASEITPVIDTPAPAPATPAKKKPRKLFAEYNGVVYTRTTSNDYKYIAVVNLPWMGEDYNVITWHKTAALASKSTLTATQKENGATVIAVVEIGDQPLTPSVVSSAHVPDKPQDTVPTPAGMPAVPTTAPGSIPTPAALTSTGKVVGSHGATIYRDNSTGRDWLFKPSPAGMGTFMADIDIATARLHELAGLPTPTTGKITLDGRSGSIQQMYEGATEPFGYNFKPQDLTPEDKLAIQKEQIFDWLVGNHDGHSRNYVRLPGGELVGIDKGQAFKFFGSDDLDPSFKPNNSMPAANLLMQAYANGEGGGALILGINHPEIKKLLKKIDNIFNSDYREILRPYATNAAKYQMLAKGGPAFLGLSKAPFPPNDVEAFLDYAEDRKVTLKEDFEILYADMAKRRKAKQAAMAQPQLESPAPAPAPAPEPVSEVAALTGDPVVMNTATLVDTTYSHGQVVGENKKWNERVVWNATSKKFEHQIGGPNWVTAESLSKSAAVKYFPKQLLNTWTAPLHGDKFADMPAPLPHIAGQKGVGSNPFGLPAPVDPFTVSQLITQEELTGLSDAKEKEAFTEFLAGGAMLMDDTAYPDDMFLRLLEVQRDMGDPQPSLFSLVRMIDRREHMSNPAATKKIPRVENRIRMWLGTPDGMREAGEMVKEFADGEGTAERETPTRAAVQMLELKGKPSKAKLNATVFRAMTNDEGRDFYAKVAPDIKSRARAAIRNYTGADYVLINGAMRGQTEGGETYIGNPVDFIRAGRIQRLMRPLPDNIRLYRGANPNSLGFTNDNPPTLAKLQAMIGQTFQDPGFTSTSILKEKAFGYMNFSFVIEAPKGTPALYLEALTSSMGEREMLLAAGTKYQIVSVTKHKITGTNNYDITLRIVP